METPPIFNSVEDECRYWKERSKLYHKEWTDVKQEYDEYVEQSREMEAEMDATLEQKQSIIKDLKMKLNMLEKENESIKIKLESHTIEISNVEKKLEHMQFERDSMKDYMRQLEQKNDDLERAHRILNESIVDFEKMLDKAYEKNALLEMEVDEKEILQEKLQRLMDETRDLKQELNVQSRYQQSNGSSANNSLNSSVSMPCNGIVLNGDKLQQLEQHTNSMSAITKQHTASAANINNSAALVNKNDYNQHQHSFKTPDNLINGNAMSASSRTNALNIVADMLRKLNLDKTLLCPDCARFRCVCVRVVSSTTQQPTAVAAAQPSSASCIKSSSPLGRSAVGSNNSLNAMSAASTPTSSTDSGCDVLRMPQRSSLTSLNNLNFGTNIFKRFAARMRDEPPTSPPP